MVGTLIAIGVLLAIAGFHVYWSFGGEVGKSAAIPERDGKPIIRPSAAGTFAVSCLIAASAAIIALRAGFIDWPGARPLINGATWVLAIVFAVRAIGDFRYVGFFKSINGTRFSRLDTLFYSPLCCVLAALIGHAASR